MMLKMAFLRSILSVFSIYVIPLYFPSPLKEYILSLCVHARAHAPLSYFTMLGDFFL